MPNGAELGRRQEMRYALGIDGGGSKCEAALLKECGTVVGWGRGGPIHSYYDPPEVIDSSYLEAIRAALSGVAGAELWAAGHIPPIAVLERAVGDVGRVCARLPAREEDTAFASAQVEWGLVALSGTGSFLHGRTADGRDRHFGGLGPVLGDYGSAYAIGLAGLRAAFASDWTPGRRTTLAEAVPRAVGVGDLRSVFYLVYVEQMNRRQIAALARTVDATAEAGDQVAIAMLQQAADDLADTAVDLIGELQMGGLAFPLVLIGGVAHGSRLWRERLLARITAVAPGARPVLPSLPPAIGAALLALRRMGVEWSAAVMARAEETFRSFASSSPEPG